MIQASRFATVKQLFAEAAALPGVRRGHYLEGACGGDAELRAEVQELLDHDANPVAALSEEPEPLLPERAFEMPGLPLRLGQYLLAGPIGEGSNGIVFQAQQESPHRMVAVKLLRPGTATARALARFRREADLLARLNHPGIAAVYEAGTAPLPWGNQPFIVMELVRGVPLIQYAREHRLSVRDRLGLTARVCEAVEYAHSRRTLHGDLKPSNILVTSEGQPKLLDFGLARTIEGIPASFASTTTGFMGTLAYMSPEVAGGQRDQVGPASDVFAIGVLLYELLSGTLPVQVEGVPMMEALRRIREHRALPLGRVSPACKGDIEIITAKALALDPRQRYATAGALAADLRRVLAHEPISARPPTLVYVAARTMRRHRAVAAMAAVALIAIVSGISVAMWQVLRAQQDARAAHLALVLFEKLTKARNGNFAELEPVLPDTLRALSSEARGGLNRHPELESIVQFAIGNCFQEQLDNAVEAEPLLRRALALARETHDYPGDRAGVAYAWARAASQTCPCPEDEAVFRAGINEWDQAGIHDRRPLVALLGIAWSMVNRDKTAQAQGVVDELGQRLTGYPATVQDEFRSRSRALRAYIALQLHRPEEAEQIELSVAELLKGPRGSKDWRQDIGTQALIQAALGQDGAARALWERNLLEFRSQQEVGFHHILRVRTQIAGLAWLEGDIGAAEQQFAQLAVMATNIGDTSALSQALNSQGVCLRDLGRYAPAEETLLKSLELRLKLNGPDNRLTADTRANLAKLFLATGRARDALREASESHRVRRFRFGEAHRSTIESLTLVGLSKAGLGGPGAGLPEVSEAYGRRLQGSFLTDWQTDVAVEGLVELLTALGRGDEALATLEHECELLKAQRGLDNAATARAENRLWSFQTGLLRPVSAP